TSFEPLARLSENVSKPAPEVGIGQCGLDVQPGSDHQSNVIKATRSGNTFTRHISLPSAGWVYATVWNDNDWLALKYVLRVDVLSTSDAPMAAFPPPKTPEPLRLKD